MPRFDDAVAPVSERAKSVSDSSNSAANSLSVASSSSMLTLPARAFSILLSNSPFRFPPSAFPLLVSALGTEVPNSPPSAFCPLHNAAIASSVAAALDFARREK